jgi:indoleamine 2,3-dioxygenase
MRPSDISAMLECYDISPERGFALSAPSISTFADPQFQPWVDAAKNLPMLISTHRLRSTIDGWPILSSEYLLSLEEYRLAYVLLGHLTAAYVWGSHEDEGPLPSIPAPLSIPFLEIVQELEVPVGICFASTALWNYTILPDGKEGCLCSFTGTEDEIHFNLTSYRVEVAGAAALTSALLASRLSTVGPAVTEQIITHLQDVAQSLGRCKEELTKMKNGLGPDIFYFNIRPYLFSSIVIIYS